MQQQRHPTRDCHELDDQFGKGRRRTSTSKNGTCGKKNASHYDMETYSAKTFQVDPFREQAH
jgi:hypothetical protein